MGALEIYSSLSPSELSPYCPFDEGHDEEEIPKTLRGPRNATSGSNSVIFRGVTGSSCSTSASGGPPLGVIPGSGVSLAPCSRRPLIWGRHDKTRPRHILSHVAIDGYSEVTIAIDIIMRFINNITLTQSLYLTPSTPILS